MNLAILHYHLNRGGVTRVIENQLAALDAVLEGSDPWRVAVVFGGRREGFDEDLPARLRSMRLSLHEVPLLDYDNVWPGRGRQDAEELHRQLTSVLHELHFAPRQTVLHLHNHSLGKNRHLPWTLPRLVEDGYAILLQIHDFAEDFRPDNYRRIGPAAAELLYPQAEGIHYAVLNGRDFDVLQEAGTQPGRLHLLPNPVPELARLPSRSTARGRLQERFDVGRQDRFVLYPVRCIRRKNLGEALLYSALAPEGTVVGLTLAPLNPAHLPIYHMWKELAETLRLPCRFEVGAPGALRFAENLAAADLILTTSLAEGFGMAFLESWLAGRPLVGRDLPEITRDFTELGLRFDWLRPWLRVPVEWVGVETFQQTLLEAYRRTLQAYGRVEPADLAAELAAKAEDGLVDFGDLDETLQQRVLEMVCNDQCHRRRALQLNPWIEEALSARHAAAGMIEHNAQAIRRHFSREPSGRRLIELYRQVLASPRKQPPQRLADGGRILDQFLAFRRFRPIRS